MKKNEVIYTSNFEDGGMLSKHTFALGRLSLSLLLGFPFTCG
jgi:hypothetical protein